MASWVPLGGYPCLNANPPLAMSDTVPNHSPDAALHGCCACGLRFESACSLRHHRSARHSTLLFSSDSKEYVVAPDENGYACPLGNCSQPYRNRDGLQRHLRKQHGVKFSNGTTACVPNPSTLPGNARSQGTSIPARVFLMPVDLMLEEKGLRLISLSHRFMTSWYLPTLRAAFPANSIRVNGFFFFFFLFFFHWQS